MKIKINHKIKSKLKIFISDSKQELIIPLSTEWYDGGFPLQ
jgi:hypothetical protein